MPNPAINRTLHDEAAQRRLCQTLGISVNTSRELSCQPCNS